MGRNAKPLDLVIADGKKHLTKEEIAYRKSSEIKLKNLIIKPDEIVLTDKRALKEFKRLKKLYEEIDFVGTLDSHIINQYCLSVSELDDLVLASIPLRQKMRDAADGGEGMTAAIDFMGLDKEIRQKRAEIIKLSDRLYLNPVSRTKNLPKQESEKPPDENADLFGDTG